MNIFDTGDDSIEHTHISHNVTNTHAHLSDLNKIRNILTLRIFSGDPEDVKNEDIGANTFDEEDLEKIPSDSPKAHSDSSSDATYTSLPKRIPKPFQKVQLNEK